MNPWGLSVIRGKWRWLLVAAAALIAPAPAEAHTALKSMGSFWSGAVHLLTSLDQVGFLLGLAILAGFADRRNDARIIAASFAAVLLGASAAWAAGWQADLSMLAAALMIVVGLAGAAQWRAGVLSLTGLALAGGAIGGLAGGDAATGLSLALFSLGAALAAAATVSYALIAIRAVKVGWGPIAWRAGASWVAAIGMMIFAFDCSRYFGHR